MARTVGGSVLLSFALMACADATVGLDLRSSRTSAIYYGVAAPNDDAVVALTYQREAFCTGTLITPTMVLTAAHCLADFDGDPTGIGVFFGDDAYGTGTTRSVRRIAGHPDYSDWQLTADIGMLELNAAAPSTIQPIPYLPTTLGLSSSDVGAAIRFVGYGFTETGDYGERRQSNGLIGRVCTTASGCSYLGNGIVPGAFGYSQAEGGPCSGDSGGPAFLERDGVPYVVGVTSYGDEDCTLVGVSTTVSTYELFITDFLAGNGGGPIDDPSDCVDASCITGAACLGDGSCGGGFCIDQSSNPDFLGGYCSAPCGSSRDCSGNGECVDFGDGAVVCIAACSRSTDCRMGYVCDFSAGSGLCLPGEREEPIEEPVTPNPEPSDAETSGDGTDENPLGCASLPPQLGVMAVLAMLRPRRRGERRDLPRRA